MTGTPDTMLQVRSLLSSDGTLEVALERAPVPRPGPDEVVVRIDAAPINPSDVWPLLAGIEPQMLERGGTSERPTLRGKVSAAMLPAFRARLDKPLPVGNEGAGVVIAAGDSPRAKALLGRTVGVAGGSTYAQARLVPAAQCLPLPEGTSAAEGAAWFVNPMTVLAMVETMRREGHTAIVHTAAASNLGQMLQKIGIEDGIPLVNVVRRPEQAELLRSIGARHVVDSSREDFAASLVAAIAETRATIAFDAIGGGKTADQILVAMETVLAKDAKHYSPYGSSVHKQVYIYGSLAVGPVTLSRSYGLAWGVGGWLVMPTLERIGAEATQRLRERVAANLKGAFASHYAEEISLAQLLDPEVAARYASKATGAKVLVRPQS